MAAITVAQAPCLNAIHFLDTIGYTEGTISSPVTQNDGYDVIVNGDGKDGHPAHEAFTSYADQPFMPSAEYPNGRPAKEIVAPGARFPKGLDSSASGRYQIIRPTWVTVKAKLTLPDFSPLSQDLAALELIRERGAIPHLISGDIETAVKLCANIWASLPGNDYGQGGKTMADVLAHFAALQNS
jgi:muramidase (phage lysozyme)